VTDHRMLSLKADLLVEGVSATPGALKDVGVKWKEQNHGLFGWDFEDHAGKQLPDDFLLPDGTVVQFRMNSRSPYLIEEAAKRLVLRHRGEQLCEVNFIPRPSYYGKRTNANNPMVKIGQNGGVDCLFFCYQNYCSHFSKGEQCLFCNLVSTATIYNSVLKKKETEDIGEVARTAFSEGTVKHVLLTGGCFEHQKEIEVVGSIFQAIRAATGLERVPGTILLHPPGPQTM